MSFMRRAIVVLLVIAVVVGLIWYVVGKGADRDVTSSDKNDQGSKYSDKD